MANPLKNGERPSGRTEAWKRVDGVMMACSWEDFVASMNEGLTRPGRYITVEVDKKRTIEWMPYSGSVSMSKAA